jgi:hypothetical protein
MSAAHYAAMAREAATLAALRQSTAMMGQAVNQVGGKMAATISVQLRHNQAALAAYDVPAAGEVVPVERLGRLDDLFEPADGQQPGYHASDILGEVQGALWDRVEHGSGSGMIGAAVGEAGSQPAGRADWLVLTDSYEKPWRVTVEEVVPDSQGEDGEASRALAMQEALTELAHNRDRDYLHADDREMILRALGEEPPFTCKACGRPEDECSAAPCPAVIADREG